MIEKLRGITAALCRVAALVSLAASIGTPVYQAFLWLKDGIWHPFTVREGAGLFVPSSSTFWQWVYRPEEWKGLSRIVYFTMGWPLFGFCLAAGIVLLIAAEIIDEK